MSYRQIPITVLSPVGLEERERKTEKQRESDRQRERDKHRDGKRGTGSKPRPKIQKSLSSRATWKLGLVTVR